MFCGKFLFKIYTQKIKRILLVKGKNNQNFKWNVTEYLQHREEKKNKLQSKQN